MTDPAYENICLMFHWAFVFMPNVSSLSLPIFMEVIFLVALPGPSLVKVALLLWPSQPPGGAQGPCCLRGGSLQELGRILDPGSRIQDQPGLPGSYILFLHSYLPKHDG